MAIYTEIHDFKQNKIPSEHKVAIIQVQPAPSDPGYEKYITGLIAQALWEHQCNFLIMPKNSGCDSLDRTIAKLLEQQDRNIIAVCGSYVHQNQNRSTILVKKGKQIKCYFQYQLQRNDTENQFCRHLFVNTYIGDFAVILCDDNVDESELQYFNGLVDVMVIIAHNKENIPADRKLKEYCQKGYCMVCYANNAVIPQYDEEDKLLLHGGESGFYLPYQADRLRKQKTIPTGTQDIISFELDVGLLEQGRAGKNPAYPNGNSLNLATPSESIQLHYTNPRDKGYWLSILEQKDKQKHLPGINLERWEVSLKEENKWKFREKIHEYHITDKPQTFGRSRKSDVVIDNPRISGQHAKIFCEGLQYYIMDLGSSGGTFSLEKKRIRLAPNKEFLLKSGDFFWLAKENCFSLQFSSESQEPPLLEMWEGSEKIFETYIFKFPCIIGTNNKDLMLEGKKNLVPEHAKLIRKDDKILIQDMGTGAVFIWPSRPYVKPGAKIEPNQPYPLEDGSLFCFAQDLFFRIRYDVAPLGNSPNIYTPEN